MKRKGYIGDIAMLAVILLVLAIVVLFVSKVATNANANLQDKLTSTDGKQIMSDNTGRFGNIFDWIFVSTFVLLMLVVVVSFFMIDTHPALFFIAIFLLGMMLVAVGILSSTYTDISTEGDLTVETAKFPLMDYMMSNWGLIMTVAGFLGIIVLYAKIKSGWL